MTSNEKHMYDVLVVGASIGGLSVVEGLRREGFAGTIGVLGAEKHMPYDRPPLSKQVLSGEWQPEATSLRTSEQLQALKADFVLGVRATSLDVAGRAVALDNGSVITYGSLVIATGLEPRCPEDWRSFENLHALHTLDDNEGLRAQLASADDVVVIGAGVLGCEIAATVRALGRSVALLDQAPRPMQRQVADSIGDAVAALHTAEGVRLLMGAKVSGFEQVNGRLTAVVVDDEAIRADLVVVAIGGSPATGWLEGSGLTIDDGVECDGHLLAGENIYAVGDVASWPDPVSGLRRRVESRTNAVEQGLLVAGNIAGEAKEYRPVPYFWTDQYRTKIQIIGTSAPGAETAVVEGAVSDGRFVAETRERGVLVGALGWNNPRGVMMRRVELVQLVAQVTS